MMSACCYRAAVEAR